MIGVERAKEPRGLRRARTNRLERAIKAYNTQGACSKALTETLIAYGSKATKAALFLAQHKKCVWCERRTDFSSNPVEHYRPKNGAWRHERGESRRVDPDHYWWLTWTWENLLFSCVRCNDSGHKANYFPLRKKTQSIPVPGHPIQTTVPGLHFDTSKEEPLLLDPSHFDLDPLDHIEWQPVDDSVRREDWLWAPRSRTEEGRVTISTLRLDELADEAANHLKVSVLRGVEEIEGLVEDGRKARALCRWNTLLLDVLCPEASFSGVAYWALVRWQPNGFPAPNRPGRGSCAPATTKPVPAGGTRR